MFVSKCVYNVCVCTMLCLYYVYCVCTMFMCLYYVYVFVLCLCVCTMLCLYYVYCVCTMFMCLYYVYGLLDLDAGRLARARIRKVLRPAISTQVFLVSLCLQANAQMVPQFPSCYYMPLMQPSRLKFSSYFFSPYLCTCKITTATG